MPVFTSAAWRMKVKEFGGNAALKQGAKAEAVLKKCEKAVGTLVGPPAMLEEVRFIPQLQKEIMAFRAASAGNAQLVKWLDEKLQQIKDQVREGERIANPMIKVKESLPDVVNGCKKIAATGDGKAYGLLWGGPVRSVHMGLRDAMKMDPRLKQFLTTWDEYAKADWALGGVNVVKGVPEGTPEYAKRIKGAAKEIGTAAMQMTAQLRQMHYIS